MSGLLSQQPEANYDMSLSSNPRYENLMVGSTYVLPAAMESSSHQRTFDSAISDLSSMMWKMSIRDTGEPSFTGPSGNFSLDDSEERDNTISSPSISMSSQSLEMDGADTWDYFFRLFMEHINPFYLFLHGLPPPVPQFCYSSTVSSNNVLTNAVLAAGACYAGSEMAARLGQTYASRAGKMVIQCCRDDLSLSLVQGLAILTWRELTLGSDHTAWMYNCMYFH